MASCPRLRPAIVILLNRVAEFFFVLVFIFACKRIFSLHLSLVGLSHACLVFLNTFTFVVFSLFLPGSVESLSVPGVIFAVPA